MNTELIIRYAAELAMLIPAAVIAIMPVYRAKRIKALPPGQKHLLLIFQDNTILTDL